MSYNYFITETHITFQTLSEAEKEIGTIRIPKLSSDYRITRVTYDNDGFTHPVTKVFYRNQAQEVVFMIASGWFEEYPAEVIEHQDIKDIKWIANDEEYILRWRSSNKESYKFLITSKEEDKEWFIGLAEEYERL
ncbi:hypothetical protein MFMK1_003622 [Metallumcola ferriviriculae]|uniref:PH domain-containing protein n=1 Tax=Metallumcola ferriviriculae TaxID=3039180 RepID=A0AAU0UTY3_9FIRM|nr:hypothetical protein MFMK1_003622 [Desulfitibacteraceae bacterium MK1]